MSCIKTLWYFSLFAPYTFSVKYNATYLDKLRRSFRHTTNFFCSELPANTTVEGPPWRILFFGSDDFSVKHLERLCSKYNTRTLISDLAVCTTKDSQVSRLVHFEKLHLYQWPLKVEDILNKYDLGVVVSFGYMIPKKIIDAVPLGILNVHASLLPRWRGAAPIHYAIMKGDNETGVTVMRINPHHFDNGDIVRQYKCPIGTHETTPQLRVRLAEYGANLLMECIRDLPKCLEEARPQDDGVTHAPRVTAKTARIDWYTMTADDIYNMQRALGYLYALRAIYAEAPVRLFDIKVVRQKNRSEVIHKPFDYTIYEPKNTKEIFMDSEADNSITRLPSTTPKPKSPLVPGRIIFVFERKMLLVECHGGDRINVGSVCMYGKKRCSPMDFFNGYLSFVDKHKRVFD